MKKIQKLGLAAAATSLLLVGGTTGAVAADMIGSKDIKDGSIRAVDLTDNLVEKINEAGKRGPRGFAGQDGVDGADGADGTDGVDGKDGATGPAGPAGSGAAGPAGPAGPAGSAGGRGPAGADGVDGEDGEDGARGPAGVSEFAGAFYAVANYNAGDTNAGAIATVACSSTSNNYTAIAGGVQVLGLDAGANARNTPVSSSFPGRMNWDTNAPRNERLDGWIVQFGGNAGATSDKAPEKVRVWALCVPTTDIEVRETYTQVS